ncbi:RNA polymerase sigma factor [Desulforhopalus sp. IMCC35007]|uniref:RNA polymerase sigma factor n=1 Tax=Desulforhopalus sp. IMCC35007 TaxID=2569543 RepID=UPI0010ADF554|nr:RNA polymerase sigma factor [Desulforhopalus sp. IMCC35007]TKB06807.1 RNA polymerase sigma factor [Desulforhopalus sp. IMCC35007]
MPGQYKHFYLNYKDKLFSYLLYKCGDRELALEVTQESFVRHLKSYNHNDQITPSLLFTIARNALVDVYRSRGKFKIVESPERSTGVNEEDRFIVREESSLMYEAMKKLDETDRELLVLAVNGVPYREIGNTLNLSAVNVKVRIHRARTQLRKFLVESE